MTWPSSGVGATLRFLMLAQLAVALLPVALHAQERAPVLRSGDMGGFHVGVPASLSLAMGGYRELSRADTTRDSDSRFWFLVVEPGLDAGRFSVGYGDGAPVPVIAATIRLTTLRVWREAVANYVGVEGALTVIGLSLRAGIFGRRGGGELSAVRFGVDVGFGM